MSIVTLCGMQPNDADCSYCLDLRECREKREREPWVQAWINDFTRLHGKVI